MMDDTVIKDLNEELNACFQLYVEHERNIKKLLICYGQHFFNNCAEINTRSYCYMCQVFDLKEKARKRFKDNFNGAWFIDIFYPEDFVSFILYNRL